MQSNNVTARLRRSIKIFITWYVLFSRISREPGRIRMVGRTYLVLKKKKRLRNDWIGKKIRTEKRSKWELRSQQDKSINRTTKEWMVLTKNGQEPGSSWLDGYIFSFSISLSLSLSLSLPLSTSFSLALSVRVSLRSWLRLTLTRTWWDMVHKYIYGFQWTVLSAYIERQTVAGPDPNPTFAMININVARKMNISGAECTRIRSNYVQSVWQQKVQKMLALIKIVKKLF